MFPVGHNVVVHHLESKAQRFIPGLVESDGITAVAVSGNRRYCAIAEKSDNAPIIIFDLTTLKRRKALVSVEAGSQANMLPGEEFNVCMGVGNRESKLQS